MNGPLDPYGVPEHTRGFDNLRTVLRHHLNLPLEHEYKVLCLVNLRHNNRTRWTSDLPCVKARREGMLQRERVFAQTPRLISDSLFELRYLLAGNYVVKGY